MSEGHPGAPWSAAWSSHKISSEEIDQLQAFFSKVLELSETVIEDSCWQWDGLAMLVQSLGRRVSTAWISKEVRSKANLDYDPEIFPIKDDHFILRFKSERECSSVRHGGSWFVAGQLLAVENWVPDFVPSRKAIQWTVVWLRLPELPLEYWVPSVILAIVAKAGRPLAVDEFTDRLRKTGYAQVEV